jgi:ribose-phosphate pyrophosphokinase
MSLKIFAGQRDIEFAKRIAKYSYLELGEIYHHNFPSGESYCQFKENIRGDDVFLVQGITKPANENLMDILIMADAARRSSAQRITAVIPYFGYARQDRKDKSRVPISAKLVMDLLQAAGVNRILTMDLHAAQIQGFTNQPVDCLEFQPVLVKRLNELFYSHYDRNNLMVVAPDIGAVKRSEKYAKSLKAGLALIVKTRKSDTEVDIESFVGDVKDKKCIIVDDLTESAGTLVQAATACKERGASSVVCAVTHGCFTQTAYERLTKAFNERIVDMFIHSDTVNYGWSLNTNNSVKPDRIFELSVSEVFAKAIRNIHENKSISELFI